MKLVHIIASLGLVANSTLVLSQTPLVDFIQAPTGLGQCVDVAPFDDNFGWNGVCSCALEAASGFGSTISMDNNVAVIGSSQSPNACVGSGSLYIYEFSQGEWSLQQELAPSTRAAFDNFPAKVSISGNSLVASDGRNRTAFTLIDGSWVETQQLQFDQSRLRFAHTEDTLAFFTRETETAATGRIIIFSRGADALWVQTQTIEIELTGTDNVIFDVSGNTMVVAARSTDAVSSADSLGPLLIYTKAGEVWQLQQQFNVLSGAVGFGATLDVSSSAIVFQGSPEATTFNLNGNSEWIETSGAIAPFERINPVIPVPHLSSDGNSLLQVRDNYFSDPGCCSGFSTENVSPPDIQLYNFSDGQWTFTDLAVFGPEDGFSNETGFTAGFDGSNILLGTQNDNTVLALSIETNGTLLSDPLINPDAEDVLPDETNSDDTDNASDITTPVVSEPEENNSADSNANSVSTGSNGGGGSISLSLVLLALLYIMFSRSGRALSAIARDSDV